MNSPLNAPIEILAPSQIIEYFLTDYPAEKAQALLWRWFELASNHKIGILHPKELQEFTDFFERLDVVVLALALVKEEERLKASGLLNDVWSKV